MAAALPSSRRRNRAAADERRLPNLAEPAVQRRIERARRHRALDGRRAARLDDTPRPR